MQGDFDAQELGKILSAVGAHPDHHLAFIQGLVKLERVTLVVLRLSLEPVCLLGVVVRGHEVVLSLVLPPRRLEIVGSRRVHICALKVSVQSGSSIMTCWGTVHRLRFLLHQK